MNILLITVVFCFLFGMCFKIIDILREHRHRLSNIENYLFGKVIADNEDDD